MNTIIFKKIQKILQKKGEQGLSITEIVQLTKKSRSAIRIALATLQGAEKVSVRKIGMAKIYTLKA